MRQISVSIQLSQSQLKNAALVQAGLDPQAWGMRKGTRVEKDRRAAQRRGHQKHKGRLFD